MNLYAGPVKNRYQYRTHCTNIEHHARIPLRRTSKEASPHLTTDPPALSKAIGKATWGRLLKLGLVKDTEPGDEPC